MKNPVYKISFLIVLVAFIVGCRTAPIYNVDSATINAAQTNPNLSLDDVKKAIVGAGVQLGWQMKDVGDGHMVGTLFLRTHMAQVDIKYSTQTYSITYKDSQDLNYDGELIHKNYNSWVQNLNNAIQSRLMM